MLPGTAGSSLSLLESVCIVQWSPWLCQSVRCRYRSPQKKRVGTKLYTFETHQNSHQCRFASEHDKAYRETYNNCYHPVLLARTFLLFFGRIPKSGFGHETDRQKCYGCKNTGEFGVSAIRIQWTTPRTKIRPKSLKQKLGKT